VEQILLKAENVSKSFPGVRALDSIDFELRNGELHCLVGENGAGKTTFVKILSGAYPDYEGDIFLQDNKVKILNPLDALNFGIAAVHQHRDLVPTMTGVENIFLGVEQKKGIFIDIEEEYKKAKKITDLFDKNINLHIPVKNLTVAEQEIITITKALLRKHRILILDEATAPLERNERKVLFEVLKEIKTEGGMGIIFISHHIEELFEIGDKVTVFKDGQLVGTEDIKDISVNEVIKMMIGKEKREKYSKTKAKVGKEVLELNNLTVEKYLYNINFKVKKGEIMGVAGRIGSNKEKIAEAIFGLNEPTRGSIIFKNEELLIRSPSEAIKKGIGLLPIDRREEGLVLSRGVMENIVLTWINKLQKLFSSMLTLKNKAREFIEKLDIKATSINQRVEYLSGGNQQKVVLAKWLVADSDILILLEPTEGIDVRTRWEIYQLLENLANEGKGILVISSDLDELLTISDRIIIMSEGRVIEEVEGSRMNKEYIFEKTISNSA